MILKELESSHGATFGPPFVSAGTRLSVEYITVTAVTALAYFVAGKLGLMVASVHPSATAVWAPTGIALAALLLYGYRVWPAIALGAFVLNLQPQGSTVLTAAAIAAGNIAEGLLGAFLVNRFAGGWRAFEYSRYVYRFAILAGLLSTTASATIGAGTVILAGTAAPEQFWPIWQVWWIGDVVGALVVTPFLVLAFTAPRSEWTRRSRRQFRPC